MIADYFTKPLQGALFVKFRDVIKGMSHSLSLEIAPTNIKIRIVLEGPNSKSSIKRPVIRDYDMHAKTPNNSNLTHFMTKRILWVNIVKGMHLPTICEDNED